MSLFGDFRARQAAALDAARAAVSSATSRPLPGRYPWVQQSPTGSPTPTAPSTSRTFDDGGRFGWDAKAIFDQYTAGIDYTAPDALDQLEAALRAGGVDFERRKDGAGDLFRIAGTDAGWVDVLQNKAAVEGRGPVRGWVYQPFYGREDFDRLVGLGRNPHTGEYVGMDAARTFTREGGGPSAVGSMLGVGGVPGQRTFKTAPGNTNAGRQSTISAGYRAAAPVTRRAAISSTPSMFGGAVSSSGMSSPGSAPPRRSGGSVRVGGVLESGWFSLPHPLNRAPAPPRSRPPYGRIG